MAKYYFKKKGKSNLRKYFRILSIIFIVVGLGMITYVLLPLILWYVYFQAVFAVHNTVNPIPKGNLFSSENNLFLKEESKVSKYLISIPKLKIENALVSTTDLDTAKHLVNYGYTNIPGKRGNALIFGHSSLPRFFNTSDYKTIFSNIYRLKNGDKIYATVDNSIYLYKVIRSIVVEASDTSIFQGDYSNSYITLVTCTPPGTVWKRLIVKARFEKII